MCEFIKNIEPKKVFKLQGLVDYKENGIDAFSIVQRKSLIMKIMVIDCNVTVPKHPIGGDSLSYLLEGKAEITLNDDKKYILSVGDALLIPSKSEPLLKGIEKTKILLIQVRDELK